MGVRNSSWVFGEKRRIHFYSKISIKHVSTMYLYTGVIQIMLLNIFVYFYRTYPFFKPFFFLFLDTFFSTELVFWSTRKVKTSLLKNYETDDRFQVEIATSARNIQFQCFSIAYHELKTIDAWLQSADVQQINTSSLFWSTSIAIDRCGTIIISCPAYN